MKYYFQFSVIDQITLDSSKNAEYFKFYCKFQLRVQRNIYYKQSVDRND